MLKHRPSLSQAYTIGEFAALMGVVPKTVQRWIANGKLHAHKIGRVVRITDEDARAFLALHRY